MYGMYGGTFMAKEITPTEFRKNLYRFLDEVLNSGTPLDITRKGRKLRIVPLDQKPRLHNLEPHPGTMNCDPEDLVHIDWSDSWKPEI